MNLKVLFGLLIYWVAIFFMFGGVLTGDILFTEYSTSGELNSTFDEEELDLDEVGFFATIGVIFGAIGRFIALMIFGLTPQLTGDLQVIFSLIHGMITVTGIGWLIASLWNG